MEQITLARINTKIARLQVSERVTKQILGELSREMLEYVVIQERWDSDAINRLNAVLTPVNKKAAVLFFAAFTPFIVDDKGIFGAMAKDKKAKAKAKLEAMENCTRFLLDEEANIWTWASENVKVEVKDIDWSKRITSAVASAMDEEKGGMGLPDVLESVLKAGVSLEDIVGAMAILAKEIPEEEAEELPAILQNQAA